MRQKTRQGRPERVDTLWERIPKSGCCNAGMFQRVIRLRSQKNPDKPIAQLSVCIDCKRRFGPVKVLSSLFNPEYLDTLDKSGCDVWEMGDGGILHPVFLSESLVHLNRHRNTPHSPVQTEEERLPF